MQTVKHQNTCPCGNRIGRYATLCRKCESVRRAKVEEAKAADRKIVQTGKCPTCGCTLRPNLSITGWWQCSQLGADTHRADPNRPRCDWQAFI